MAREFAPPLLESGSVPDALGERGFVVLPPSWFLSASGLDPAACDALASTWTELPPDAHLRDGGHYRRRRHSSFVVESGACRLVPHRAHYQPVEYNALHGGMERWFEPISDAVARSSGFSRLVTALASVFDAVAGARTWFVEAHQFRIDVHEGIGRPTPEGAHRDGVDFVAIVFVGRASVKGGETRVFEATTPSGVRFTLSEPWSVLLLDDARVVHESTPLQPSDVLAPSAGHRDTLVLTFRRGGFQERR